MYLLQIGGDGTVYVRSIKEYHEVNTNVKNRNANENNRREVQNGSQNESRNVSPPKNARYLFNYFFSPILNLISLKF